MKFLDDLLNYFLPLGCEICGKYDWASSKLRVCKACASPLNLHKLENKVCPVCKSILLSEKCEYCNSRNIFFTEIFYLRFREKKEKELLQALKFHEAKQISNYFRLGIGKFLSRLKKLELVAVIPLPSNQKTIRFRPYHVCHSLFPYLEKKLNIPIINLLIKKSHELQSGKTYRNRFFHARFAFEIKKEYSNKLKGNYLILDDLFTTGASLNECARILLENGADKVYGLTLLKGK